MPALWHVVCTTAGGLRIGGLPLPERAPDSGLVERSCATRPKPRGRQISLATERRNTMTIRIGHMRQVVLTAVLATGIPLAAMAAPPDAWITTKAKMALLTSEGVGGAT